MIKSAVITPAPRVNRPNRTNKKPKQIKISVHWKYHNGGMSEKKKEKKGGGLNNPAGKAAILTLYCGMPMRNIIAEAKRIRYSPSWCTLVE